MSMSELQRHQLIEAKNAGRLQCARCGRLLGPGDRSASVGYPNGEFYEFCLPCGKAVAEQELPPDQVDHTEFLDTTARESERYPGQIIPDEDE